jgi:hypothetical protein
MMIDYRLINGYDNYVISTNGDVYSKKTKRYIKPFINKTKFIAKDGTIKIIKYKRVSLCKNGIRKKFLIHRLIALHFIPNPENKPMVDHEDGDTLNNDLSNLRWATRSENRRNIKTKGYHIEKQKIGINRYRVRWRLIENGPRQSKAFLTRELAEAWACTQTFPMCKNYNVEF